MLLQLSGFLSRQVRSCALARGRVCRNVDQKWGRATTISLQLTDLRREQDLMLVLIVLFLGDTGEGGVGFDTSADDSVV